MGHSKTVSGLSWQTITLTRQDGDNHRYSEAEWQRLQRGQQSMELTLAEGRADIIPESPIRLRGWKASISTTDWLMSEIKHTINDSGFITQLMLETAIDT